MKSVDVNENEHLFLNSTQMPLSHPCQQKNKFIWEKQAPYAYVVFNITQQHSSASEVDVNCISLPRQVTLALLCWSVEYYNRLTISTQHIDHSIWHHNNTSTPNSAAYLYKEVKTTQDVHSSADYTAPVHCCETTNPCLSSISQANALGSNQMKSQEAHTANMNNNITEETSFKLRVNSYAM